MSVQQRQCPIKSFGPEMYFIISSRRKSDGKIQNNMPPIWETVFLGSCKYLDSEGFIFKIFKILVGDGDFSCFKYIPRHQEAYFNI